MGELVRVVQLRSKHHTYVPTVREHDGVQFFVVGVGSRDFHRWASGRRGYNVKVARVLRDLLNVHSCASVARMGVVPGGSTEWLRRKALARFKKCADDVRDGPDGFVTTKYGEIDVKIPIDIDPKDVLIPMQDDVVEWLYERCSAAAAEEPTPTRKRKRATHAARTVDGQRAYWHATRDRFVTVAGTRVAMTGEAGDTGGRDSDSQSQHADVRDGELTDSDDDAAGGASGGDC